MSSLPNFRLISLRPTGQHESLRRATMRRGGQLLAMAPWRIVPCTAPEAKADLAAALACPLVIFTSPQAVRMAARLAPLQSRPQQAWLAVGEGSRRALQRAGVRQVSAPQRMDSEGLLALPEIAKLDAGDTIGLVSAPGGRGEIVRKLSARGIHVQRADIYQRQPLRIRTSRWQALQQALDTPTPVHLALSSGEALQLWLAQAPQDLPLDRIHVLAASDRLAQQARQAGFVSLHIAANARADALLAALPATV